jgi:hypothetical protein
VLVKVNVTMEFAYACQSLWALQAQGEGCDSREVKTHDFE